MKKFELYHPIHTEHFILDWLTKSKIKDVFALMSDQKIAQSSGRIPNHSIEETTHFVNEMMRQIMKNKQLVWGVSDKKTQEFLGLFAFKNFDLTNKESAVYFETIANHQHQGIMFEVLTRMSAFAFDELHLDQINATFQQNNIITMKLLNHAGFSYNPDKDHDGLLTYELKNPNL